MRSAISINEFYALLTFANSVCLEPLATISQAIPNATFGPLLHQIAQAIITADTTVAWGLLRPPSFEMWATVKRGDQPHERFPSTSDLHQLQQR
jgi:hypothetical protein